MERIFDTFREASQEAARLSKEHAKGASLKRRGEHWAIFFDGDPTAVACSEPDLSESEYEQFRSELDQANRDISELRKINETLRARLDILEQEHVLVKPLLIHDIQTPFLEPVLGKMSKENAETICRFGYLYSLSNLGQIDHTGFNDFKVKSGLWIAIYNYEKIKAGPQSAHFNDNPRPQLEICNSCGGAVINGHCKCSD